VAGGLVVLGDGAIPLATVDDGRAFVAVAASGEALALTNNRYSSDVIAVPDARLLRDLPHELPTDNLLPRWLVSRMRVEVDELPDRDRLAIDIDSPLDVELVRRHPACPPAIIALAASAGQPMAGVASVMDRLARLARDPRAELVVAGRTSAAVLRRLEVGAACRVRALVEERGLKASAELGETAAAVRPPASALGLLLDRDGPSAIGDLMARLGDGSVIDTRVLLAHRCGAAEAGWPSTEDRFASDLLLPERIADGWLRELTLGASTHRLPIALGGHTLVGPGLGLALGLEEVG
jgi:hypothetical protein